MAKPVLKSFAKQSGKSLKDVEKLWVKAEAEASKMGQKDNYAYITGILKNMLGIDESFTNDYKKLSKDFIKSDKKTFKEFEADGIVSADITDVPETYSKGKKKDKKKCEEK